MARKRENAEWESQGVYTEWIKKYSNKKTARKNFFNWVEWIKMTPEEQIARRKEDLSSKDEKIKRYFEEKVKEYARYLMNQGLKAKTGETYTATVRGFFSHHYLNLRFRRGELKFEALPEVKALEKPKWILNNTELRVLASVANPRDKLLILTMASTGLAPVDVSQLRIESLRLYEDGKLKSDYVFGMKRREKTNIKQHYILGEEVLFWLKLTLKERGFPKSGYLLTTRKGNKYNARDINDRLKTLATRVFDEERTKDFLAKNLRDFYHNCLMLGSVETGVIDYMMGWERAGARSSYPPVETVIKKAFEKTERYFSIDGEGHKEERMTRMENALGKLVVENQALKEMVLKYKGLFDWVDRNKEKLIIEGATIDEENKFLDRFESGLEKLSKKVS